MTLNSEAKIVNLKRSLDKYIYDSLYTGESLTIDWFGVPFNDTEKTEWIKPRIHFNKRTFFRQGNSTQFANLMNFDLSFDIYVKKSDVTNSYRCLQLRDKIVVYFKIGQDINLYNYYGDSSNLLSMRVRGIQENPISETDVLIRHIVIINIDYTELMVIGT